MWKKHFCATLAVWKVWFWNFSYKSIWHLCRNWFMHIAERHSCVIPQLCTLCWWWWALPRENFTKSMHQFLCMSKKTMHAYVCKTNCHFNIKLVQCNSCTCATTNHMLYQIMYVISDPDSTTVTDDRALMDAQSKPSIGKQHRSYHLLSHNDGILHVNWLILTWF